MYVRLHVTQFCDTMAIHVQLGKIPLATLVIKYLCATQESVVSERLFTAAAEYNKKIPTHIHTHIHTHTHRMITSSLSLFRLNLSLYLTCGHVLTSVVVRLLIRSVAAVPLCILSLAIRCISLVCNSVLLLTSCSPFHTPVTDQPSLLYTEG